MAAFAGRHSNLSGRFLLHDDFRHFKNLVAVTPLVVVPGANLYEGLVQLDTGLLIEDGSTGIVAEVGGNHSLVGVTQNTLKLTLGSGLHSGADFLVGSLLGQFASEVHEGNVGGGNTQGHAGELTVQFGENLTHGLGGAGGGRNDVLQDTAATAPILLGRTVNGLLGSGSSVNGGHEATDNTELVVEHLGDRSQAVGGAGSVGDDGLTSIGLVVHTIYEHRGSVLGRSGHDNLLGTSLDVSLSELGGEEEAGGLYNNVGVEGTPGDVGGILLAEDLNLVAVYDEVVAFHFDIVVELAMYGVVLKHVSEIIGIEQVVDTYDHDVLREVLHSSAENHTTDTAKTVNTKSDHNFALIYCLLNVLPFFTRRKFTKKNRKITQSGKVYFLRRNNLVYSLEFHTFTSTKGFLKAFWLTDHMKEETKLKWFAAKTRAGQELKVRERLDSMGIEYFIPTEKKRNYRGKMIEHPVIPALVFIFTTKEIACELKTREQLPVNYLFDYANHTMLVVPDKQMEDFQRVLASSITEGGLVDQPLSLGESVQVVKGVLKGVEGRVLEAEGKLYIVVGLLGSVFAKARIPRAWLERKTVG